MSQKERLVAESNLNTWLNTGQKIASPEFTQMVERLDAVIFRHILTEPAYVYRRLDAPLTVIRARRKQMRYVRHGYTTVWDGIWGVNDPNQTYVQRIQLLPGQHLFRYGDYGEALLPRDLEVTILGIDDVNRWVNAVATPK